MFFKKIGQNTLILFSYNIITLSLRFLLSVILGRLLGRAVFGQYNFVLIWIQSQLPFVEFGLSTVLNRDLAAEPEKTQNYFVTSLVAKNILTLPLIVGLLFFSPYLAAGQSLAVIASLRWSILLFGGWQVYYSLTAIFKAHQMMHPVLWLALTGQGILFLGTLALVLNDQPLPTLIIWAGISQGIQCLLAFGYYRCLLSTRPQWRAVPVQINFIAIKGLLLKAWPFALSGMLNAVQVRVSVLLLVYLHSDEALGLYSAASPFSEASNHLFGAFYTAMLPALTAAVHRRSEAEMCSHGNDDVVQRTLRWSRWGLFALSLGLALTGGLLARFILILTYGPDYQAATLCLQVLLIALLPSSQNHLSIINLYAHKDEHFVNLMAFLGAMINSLASFLFIPTWGPAGTALALLLTEGCLFVLYQWRQSSSVAITGKCLSQRRQA